MHEIFLHQLGFPMTDPDVALVLRPEWAAKILNGSKTMELRGTATTKRCNVAKAVAGTGKLVGQVRITDSVLLARRNPQTGMLEDVSPNGLNSTQHMHLVYNHEEVLKYKRVHGWRLEDAQVYNPPRDYRHTPGCVGWVRLGSVASKKERQSSVEEAKRFEESEIAQTCQLGTCVAKKRKMQD